MADYNKTIEIQVRADMKQLLMEMKKMPGMSAKEAKKMVSELAKNYKAAAAEAKKAAAKNKKAMDSMAAANNRVAKSGKSVRMQSREMGAAFGSLEDVVGGLNPELAGVASIVGTGGQGFRSLSRSLATGNMIVTGAVIGLAALAAVYTVFTANQRRAKEIQEAFATSVTRTTEKLQQQRDAAGQLINAQRDANRQLAVMTGEMSKLEADIEAARDKGTDELRTQLKAQNKIIKKQEEAVKLANQAAKNYQSLNDEQLKELDILAASSKHRLINEGIASNSSRRQIQLVKLAEEMNSRLVAEQGHREKIKSKNQEIVETRIKLLKAQEEYRLETEAHEDFLKQQEAEEKKRAEAKAKRDKAKLKAEKEAEKAKNDALKEAEKEKQRLEKLTESIQRKGAKARENAGKQSINNARTLIALMENEVEKAVATRDLDQELTEGKIRGLQQIQEQNILLAENEEMLKEAKLANLAIDEEIDALKQKSHIREMQFFKQRKEAMLQENKKRLELVRRITSTAVESTDAVSQIIQNVSGENKEAAKIAFRISQATALANIAMTTAQKVMEVAPNPFAIAAVAALGALQAGVVLTTPAPEFHMGGVIGKGEDTRNITVLTGEAVLDRRTVERLGGDEGINRLQRGGGVQGAEVVVLNPFKHFDRYAMASSKRGGAMAKLGNKRADRGY